MWHVLARQVASLLDLLQKINGCSDFLRLQYTNTDSANEFAIPNLVRKTFQTNSFHFTVLLLMSFLSERYCPPPPVQSGYPQAKWSPSDIGKEFIAFHHLHHTDFLVQGADMAHSLDHITGSWSVNIHGNSFIWISHAWHLAWLYGSRGVPSILKRFCLDVSIHVWSFHHI